jgi:alpha-galactosidase
MARLVKSARARGAVLLSAAIACTALTSSASAGGIEYISAEGGQWRLQLGGESLLSAAPLFGVVANDTYIDRWSTAPTPGKRADGGLTITGAVAGIPGLEATVEIEPVADASGWEFKLALKNTSDSPITVSRADAFAGRVEGEWSGLSFTSKWGEEWEPEEFALPVSREIEVRSGRSSMGQSPWLGLSRAVGGAFVIAPVWSGNWHIGLTHMDTGTAITAGISPWKFSHVLRPGATFEGPSVLLAVGDDLEAASIALTRAVAARLPRSAASEAIPVEWNHWWPYEDKEIDEATFLANVDVGTRLGIEVSLLDAGWFGAADADTGWWDLRGDFETQNRARFPRGIGWLADETRRRGQQFGIWMELEAVGLRAKVRQEKPELMARRDDDPPAEPLDPQDPGFLGYICLGSEAGRAHARGLLESVVEATRCTWIKVDFNLDPKAGCSRTDHDHGIGDGLYAHYRGLYALLDAFRAAHPEVILEGCASGGLRMDAGLLRHVHCAFLSDPDWTKHHLQVVHGASRLLPPAAMLHWPMSEWLGKHPQQNLNLRDPGLTEEHFDAIVRSGFLHRFGVSWRLPDLPDRWRERLSRHIDLYKEVVRPFIRSGELRRLTGPPLRHGNGELQPEFQLTLEDRHLFLAFALSDSPDGMRIKPTALQPEQRYRFRNLNFDRDEIIEVKTGAAWMETGLPLLAQESFIGLLEPVSQDEALDTAH